MMDSISEQGMLHSLDHSAATVALMQQWNIRQLVIDRMGISEGLAACRLQRFDDTQKSPISGKRVAILHAGLALQGISPSHPGRHRQRRAR